LLGCDRDLPAARGCEASRLAGLGVVTVGVLHTDGVEHQGVAMKGPEGNEFDIN
jgi:hypothetical protein